MHNTLEIGGRVAAVAAPAGNPRRVVLVGARRDARRLIRRLVGSPWEGLPIVGFVHAGHHRGGSMRLRSRHRHLPLHPQTDPIPVLGHIDRLDELVDRARATHVMVAVSTESDPGLRPRVIQLAKPDIAVHWVAVDAGRLDLGTLIGGESTGLGTAIEDSDRRLPQFLPPVGGRLSTARLLKRLMDITLASALLLCLMPLFALVAMAILMSSGWPIFYTQERIGQGGRRFRIIKFRSMRKDAELETGPIWASDHDKRCTRIGDWLRHTNIDELPQLFNVLRGEMSLVGPRPERPIFVEEFRKTVPDYDLRHAVPGGMTGWAQVHGWRGRTSLRKRLQYDLDYIERWSILMDFRVLLMTIQHVFWGKTSWNDAKRTNRPEG